MITTRIIWSTVAALLLSLGVACSTKTTLSEEEAQVKGPKAAVELTSNALELDGSIDSLLKTTQLLDGVESISDLKDVVETLSDCVSSDFGLTSVTLTFSAGCNVNGVTFAGALKVDIDVFPTQQIVLEATGLSVDGNTLDGTIAIKGSVSSGSLAIDVTLALASGVSFALEGVTATVSALNMMAEISGTARVTEANGDSAAITLDAVAHAGLGSSSSSGSLSVERVTSGVKTKGELTFQSTSGMVTVTLTSIDGASLPAAFQCYTVDLTQILQTGYLPKPQACL
ncbi:MAG: hypothetical protein KC609_19510 [Myxococcales bacterium]|nr:hypothetical protein [Myxococcales bacterium]